MRNKLMARRVPNWLEAQRPLTQWYATGLGQSILTQLESALEPRLKNVFGYQGLQIGNMGGGQDLLASAGLHRRLVLDAPGSVADIQGDALSLPIAADTMKAVLLFHTLDFCESPHQALREADRVLTEDGQLIIIGFNPLSVFGLRHLSSGWRQKEPWNGRFQARHRVADWLSVLDYRVLNSSAMFIRPPINSERLLRRLASLEKLQPWLGGLGGLYIMQARKQTLPMSLIPKPHWGRQRSRAMGSGSFARTGARSGSGVTSNVVHIDSFQR